MFVDSLIALCSTSHPQTKHIINNSFEASCDKLSKVGFSLLFQAVVREDSKYLQDEGDQDDDEDDDGEVEEEAEKEEAEAEGLEGFEDNEEGEEKNESLDEEKEELLGKRAVLNGKNGIKSKHDLVQDHNSKQVIGNKTKHK